MFIASTVGVDLTLTQYAQDCSISNYHFNWNCSSTLMQARLHWLWILGSVGLPLDAIGLILAVDRILDMIRTSVNVCGDATVSCIVAKSENELEEKIFAKLG